MKYSRYIDEMGRPTDNLPIKSGDTFYVKSGNITTPFPKQKSEKYASLWLIENAIKEAESNNDTWNAYIFNNTTPLRGGYLTTSDRECMLLYLFG